MTAETEALFELARQQLLRGQVDEAIGSLTRALGKNVENAQAHALLAICLRERKRLAAAQHEARLALAQAPQDWFTHLAAGLVEHARRKPARAEEHLKMAVELAPGQDWPLRELGRFYLAAGDTTRAREFIDAACAAAPDDSSNLALLAQWHLDTRATAQAEHIAREALRLDAQDHHALLVLGHAVLRQGRVDEALDHAVWAVRTDPMDEDALTLLSAVKARRSPLLGLWFRFNVFVASGSGRRALLLLMGMYLSYRVLTLALRDLGLPQAATAVSLAWLGLCVYTWVAPAIFQRMLRKELEQVQLHKDY